MKLFTESSDIYDGHVDVCVCISLNLTQSLQGSRVRDNTLQTNIVVYSDV